MECNGYLLHDEREQQGQSVSPHSAHALALQMWAWPGTSACPSLFWLFGCLTRGSSPFA